MTTANQAATSIIGLNLIVKLILHQSLKYIWGIVNTLQFIVYFKLIKVRLGAHASSFLEKLKIIALGEFIPYDDIRRQMRETVDDSINPEYLEANVFERLGITFILLIGLLLASALLMIVGLCTKFLGRPIARLVKLLKAKLFFNLIIRTSMQSYLKYTFVIVMELTYKESDTQIEFWFSVVSLGLLSVLPFIFGATAHRNQG